MTSTLPMDASPDQTALPIVVRGAGRLGLLQSTLIAAFAFIQPRVENPVELVLCGLLLLSGVAATIVLPGHWTRARTIEGIAGAAGIGLGATVVFLVLDVALFQPLRLYTNRWLEIGGGANWWYHPVWWMVGTYLAWLGAWVQANQAKRSPRGAANPVLLVIGTLALAALAMAGAVAVGIPQAAFGLGTFGVAVLPGLALMTALSALGGRRR